MILVRTEDPLFDSVGRARKPGIDILTDICKQSPELFALDHCQRDRSASEPTDEQKL